MKQLKRTVRKTLRLGRAYLLGATRGRRVPEKRFFIFAQGRSGSTLLQHLIGDHPDIQCDGEILNNSGRPFPRVYIDGMSLRPAKPVYGFKVKIYQLTKKQGLADPGAFVRGLHEDGWKLIYLWRRNVMRQALSAMMAHRTNRWHARGEADPEDREVHVDPERLLEKTQKREQNLKQERQILSDLPYLEVNYEEDLLRPEAWPQTTARVFDYLGVPDADVDVALKRTSTDDLRWMISNYAEVEEALLASEYVHLLESD